MEYLKVRWRHEFPDEPVLLFSELDSDRFEARKVEVHRNGRLYFAKEGESTGNARLGELPVPSFEEIRRPGEFVPEMVVKAEFEEVWDRARRQAQDKPAP